MSILRTVETALRILRPPINVRGTLAEIGRPAVVLAADRFNASRAGVVVGAADRDATGLPSHIEIEPGESGLTEARYAKGKT